MHIKKKISKYLSPVSTSCIILIILALSQALSAEIWAINKKLLMDCAFAFKQKSIANQHLEATILQKFAFPNIPTEISFNIQEKMITFMVFICISDGST